eukprot:CAMPEP_0180538580 /NCGR_PEP_ID=MMETSP1036_2-20121128/66428_1 /TAXON_ID=632150 /ORGANISM="Azadinium spinosum, Strain 3D9" /LENGTH=119 /DNA_ID=CAMNT_0022553257 /DNA_START=88 /DNA_END=443 /DNA_ORIENTATION=-
MAAFGGDAGAARHDWALAAQGDPAEMEKDRLVGRVKELQRSGVKGREHWEKYCDALRSGNRDPKLHGLESLRNFIDAYDKGESPEVPAAKIVGSGSKILRLRGVPFQSDILDVIEFLSG